MELSWRHFPRKPSANETWDFYFYVAFKGDDDADDNDNGDIGCNSVQGVLVAD